MRIPALLLACSLLAGCGNKPSAPVTAGKAAKAAKVADWREMATAADRERLRRWRDAWVDALAKVRAAGKSAQLAPATLFDPDRALAGATPPAGDYRCRAYKLGAKATGNLDFVAYPYFDCRIEDEGEVLSFYKLSGSQRPVGLIFKESDSRAMFLGTLVLGDEQSALQYGQDSSRDMAGVVERVDAARWRLVLPYPAFESVLDVIELVPTK